VHSFDHVAINNNVIACDISQVPLANSSLDAAIFSLSLMGINFIDYLREAHRCLRLDGYLWIAESASRIKDINLFKELLHRLGFDIRGEVEEKGKFIFIEALKSGRAINEIVLSGFDYANVLN
jgi:ubiquinone/menaquinone biosynthesis C-methylase UbiE